MVKPWRKLSNGCRPMLLWCFSAASVTYVRRWWRTLPSKFWRLADMVAAQHVGQEFAPANVWMADEESISTDLASDRSETDGQRSITRRLCMQTVQFVVKKCVAITNVSSRQARLFFLHIFKHPFSFYSASLTPFHHLLSRWCSAISNLYFDTSPLCSTFFTLFLYPKETHTHKHFSQCSVFTHILPHLCCQTSLLRSFTLFSSTSPFVLPFSFHSTLSYTNRFRLFVFLLLYSVHSHFIKLKKIKEKITVLLIHFQENFYLWLTIESVLNGRDECVTSTDNSLLSSHP